MAIRRSKVFILTNIIFPYKTFLFNALNKLGEVDFKVFYMAETEKRRDWKIDKNLKFPHEVMFKGKLDNVNPYIGRFSPEKNLLFLLKCLKNTQESEALNN